MMAGALMCRREQQNTELTCPPPPPFPEMNVNVILR